MFHVFSLLLNNNFTDTELNFAVVVSSNHPIAHLKV